uniref:Putative secreted protein n=1 Tax=Amblyomma parvum TaxID=251391 RepID=A0A023FYY6_AMBPA
MFITLAMALGTFTFLGLSNPQERLVGSTEIGAAGFAPQCGTAEETVPGGSGTITIPNHTRNCTCLFTNGTRGMFPNGTTCFAPNYKVGKCYNGDCIVNARTYGCYGKTGPEQVDPLHLCVFECTNEEGKDEWGYYPVGTPCVNRDDGDEPENWKNGTCQHPPEKHRPNETVCIPAGSPLIGC